MENFNNLIKLDPESILKNVIQPDSNIGEVGKNQTESINVQILKDEEGNVKIKTPVMCVNLSPMIICALKTFLSMEENNKENSDGNVN